MSVTDDRTPDAVIADLENSIRNLQEVSANLQNKYEQEQGNRREDRFIFILIIVILLDIMILGNLENAAVPLVVLVLELLVLAVIAARLGIQRTAAMTNRMVTAISGISKPKGDA